MLLKLSNGKGQQANFAITRFSENALTVLVFSNDIEILEDGKILNMAFAVADYKMNTRKLNTRKRNKGIGGIYFHEYLKCFAREFHFVSNDYYGPNLLPSGYDETQVNWAKGYLIAESFEIPHIWFI